MSSGLRIGVLAVQGDFREHAAMLRGLGAEPVEVRKPEQLDGLDGLVVPGGESTAFMRLMRLYGLDEAVRRFAGAGLRHVRRHDRAVALAPRARRRRRRAERVRPPARELRDRPRRRRDRRAVRAVFIRAPWITDAGPGVEVLASVDGHPVLAREGRFLVASFHPELTDDARVHEQFLDLVREESHVRA